MLLPPSYACGAQGGCCHARNRSLFGSGEALWDCVREHLSSFTYSSWIYLHNTTVALKNWALAMISGH